MASKKTKEKQEDASEVENKKFRKKIAKGIRRILKESDEIRAEICKELVKMQKMTPEELQDYKEKLGADTEV